MGKGGRGGKAGADNRANQMNPNNPAYAGSRAYTKAMADNRSNQLNPNNEAYTSSRLSSAGTGAAGAPALYPPSGDVEAAAFTGAPRRMAAGEEVGATPRGPEDALLREQVGLLVRSLRADLESIREIAIVQLSLLAPSAIPYMESALANSLSEANDSGRRGASNPELAVDGLCRALGIVRSNTSVSALAGALPREEAVRALAKIGGEKALELIVGTLEGPPDKWGGRGSGLRMYVTGHEYDGNKDQLNENLIKEVFASFGEAGRKRLNSELGFGTPERKAAVANVARIMRDEEAEPALEGCLRDASPSVVRETSRALAALKARTAVPAMIKALFELEKEKEKEKENSGEDRDTSRRNYEVRGEARRELEKALKELCDVDQMVEVATHVWGDGYGYREFRELVVENGEAAMPSLTKLLSHKDARVQALAADMIARIKSGSGRSYQSQRY